jgi:hypothetical protein
MPSGKKSNLSSGIYPIIIPGINSRLNILKGLVTQIPTTQYLQLTVEKNVQLPSV